MSVSNNAANSALFDNDLISDCITQILCQGKPFRMTVLPMFLNILGAGSLQFFQQLTSSNSWFSFIFHIALKNVFQKIAYSHQSGGIFP